MTVPERLATALADRYRVERELGPGGMATVYLAHDLKHDRKVAIKVLRPELAATLGADRFLSEIKTVAALSHPNILPLFDSGAVAVDAPLSTRDSRLLFYVMPFIEGETLRGPHEPREGAPPRRRPAAHPRDRRRTRLCPCRDVIHRDIKPENILLQSGHAVVADFGIARAVKAAGAERMTEVGLAIGTPAYMSPEQSAGERDLDGRSDLYALASVLYEMLAGEAHSRALRSMQSWFSASPSRPRKSRSKRPNVSRAHRGSALHRDGPCTRGPVRHR